MPQQGLLFAPSLSMDAAERVKQRIMQAAYARNTTLCYEYAWKAFEKWCHAAGRACLPADAQTCIDHASWCIAEGLRLETVRVRMRAIIHRHNQAHEPSPIDFSVRLFLRNAARELCEKARGKRALTVADLKRISRMLRNRGTIRDIRDRAMILLGFALGWRRSELASLDVRDIHRLPNGLEIHLGKSKMDQKGRGRTVAVQMGKRELTCPVRALDQWLAVRGAWQGSLFAPVLPSQQVAHRRLGGYAVNLRLKYCLERIGVSAQLFGEHSLRAGMATASAEAGATEIAIMQRAGWKSIQMVQRYVRPVRAFKANPLAGVL